MPEDLERFLADFPVIYFTLKKAGGHSWGPPRLPLLGLVGQIKYGISNLKVLTKNTMRPTTCDFASLYRVTFVTGVFRVLFHETNILVIHT